jgi:hypothetical protein
VRLTSSSGSSQQPPPLSSAKEASGINPPVNEMRGLGKLPARVPARLRELDTDTHGCPEVDKSCLGPVVGIERRAWRFLRRKVYFFLYISLSIYIV